MSDLIDRKELGAAIDNWLTIDRYYHPYSKQKTIPVSEVIDIIKLLPTNSIVLCRECKHYTNGFCYSYGACGNKAPDWFCADGERREEDVKK